MVDNKQEKESVIKGITICPGIGIGEAHIFSEDIDIPRVKIMSGQVEEEQKRYTRAVKLVVEHLHEHVEEYHDCSLYNTHKI